MELIEIIIITLLITIFTFALIRELICWYFKINKRITLMEENNKLLKTFFKKYGNMEQEFDVDIDELEEEE
jgi:hypothetical protein